MLECLEMNPEGPVRSVVIWLHGLGADGNDFLPIVPELKLPDALGVRFVFPHAPIRPVTLNNGMAMRAWYDIYGLDINRREDAEGVEASRDAVEALIQREKDAGVPASHIFLAGFSQGGAIVLHTGLRHSEPLGGIIALSTYLPLRDRLAEEKQAANQSIPIFQAHGSMDPMLPQQLGEISRDLLKAEGYDVAWHSYPMQHQVCLEEIQDLSRWMQTYMSRPDEG
ncbi:MAG: carboxylesterase [Salinisphaeraceae bacterium]|nr:carboxylesterase [Salinisphaeraceae bacterium]